LACYYTGTHRHTWIVKQQGAPNAPTTQSCRDHAMPGSPNPIISLLHRRPMTERRHLRPREGCVRGAEGPPSSNTRRRSSVANRMRQPSAPTPQGERKRDKARGAPSRELAALGLAQHSVPVQAASPSHTRMHYACWAPPSEATHMQHSPAATASHLLAHQPRLHRTPLHTHPAPLRTPCPHTQTPPKPPAQRPVTQPFQMRSAAHRPWQSSQISFPPTTPSGTREWPQPFSHIPCRRHMAS